MRCGPPVLSALATWSPDDLVTIKLFDANEERLDLFDRFIRECLDKANTEHVVMATSQPEEALAQATDVLFCVHEDCARRLFGRNEPNLYDPPTPENVRDQVRGDPNSPTPPHKLSQQTHSILSSPALNGMSREDVLTKALASLIGMVPPTARILSLERGVDLPTHREHQKLEWPTEVPERDLPVVPHQILRWIHGEETLDVFLNEQRANPIAIWLAG